MSISIIFLFWLSIDLIKLFSCNKCILQRHKYSINFPYCLKKEVMANKCIGYCGSNHILSNDYFNQETKCHVCLPTAWTTINLTLSCNRYSLKYSMKNIISCGCST